MSALEFLLNVQAWHYMRYLRLNFFLQHLIFLQCLNAVIFSSVSANESVFDVPCSIDENCSSITGAVTCDYLSGMCSCAEGNVRMNLYFHCLPYVGMGEFCQDSNQCQRLDPHVICSKWSQRCQCHAGYETQENNSTKMCLKSPHSESEPYFVHIFSGLDIVHIVLGCLTGGLALLACFAGIIQLVRKKWTRPQCSIERESQFTPDLGYSTTSAPSQSQPYSDLQFNTPLSGSDFACLDGNSTAPPTPGTLGEEDYVVTPPPTYEEALQQSGPGKAGSTITV